MKEMNTNKTNKTLADLNLLDRFLFSEAAENQEFMELLLEIILGEDVVLKQLPQTEKEERKALWNRQVRLDVMAVDMDETLYDTEVQKKDTYNLPRRTRLYHGLIDSRLLPPGSIDFNKLNDVFVIMIMPFDLFGEKLYKYTFRMTCEEVPGLRLGDGITTIFLNTKGNRKKDKNVSQELIDLLKYFEETTDAVAGQSDSDKIHKMQQIVESIRENENVGVKFMNAWEEKILDRQEAHEEGRTLGRSEGILEGISETALRMKEEGFEYEVISRITNLPVEDIERL